MVRILLFGSLFSAAFVVYLLAAAGEASTGYSS
jgi:hypothetical protein